MTEAAFGLAGVVVGALLSGVMTYALERRREQRLVRAAARLLEQELEPFVGPLYELRASFLMDSQERYERVARQVEEFTLALWEKHRESLASSLAIGEWYSVMFAYVSLDGLRRTLAGVPFAEARSREEIPQLVQRAESDVLTAVGRLGERGGRPGTDDPAVLRGSRW